MDTSVHSSRLAYEIKQEALSLGFDACGIAAARPVENSVFEHYQKWIDSFCHADMLYMERNQAVRNDPRLLVEGAQSIIMVALNYAPTHLLPTDHLRFANYALGQDYHDIMRLLLTKLLEKIKQLTPSTTGRVFCDTAPLLERYWGEQAGIGFVGRNTQLILPQHGSYFFLGAVICDLVLEYDKPLSGRCGTCTRCIDACPTKALSPYRCDASKCISYHTIESKKPLPTAVVQVLDNRVYGCDTCQEVCPHNRFMTPCTTPALAPSEQLLKLSNEKLVQLTPHEFSLLFSKSAVKRAKYEGLMRNINACLKK